MGDVVKFRPPRNGTIRGTARKIVTEAMRAHPKPNAVLVIVLAADGNFAVRTANYQDEIKDFDMYARAEAILAHEKMKMLE